MRNKTPLRFAIVIAAIAIGIPILISTSRNRQLSRRTEDDYRKLVESGATHVFSFYPEIFDRISADDEIAERIKFVHLSSIKSGGDYSSLAFLPNVEELEVTYAHGLNAVIPTINHMPSLRRAMFAYCDSPNSWITELHNPTLKTLEIHLYHRRHVTAENVDACQDKMPSCTITVTDDGGD